MKKLLAVAFGLLGAALNSHALVMQQPMAVDPSLIEELKRAQIIPTVLDEFTPLVTLNITWKKATAELGNALKPKKMEKAPHVQLIDAMPEISKDHAKYPQLTLALTDPDAPSRLDPKWSQVCHWILTGIDLNSLHDIYDEKKSNLHEVMPYKPPGPPKKTGHHRYVFVALSPKNGTLETLNLTKPADRQHWGYDKAEGGLREWAEENGLGVVGANFVYSQHKKQ